MPPRTTGAHAGTAPSFYITGRGGPRPTAILLAIILGGGALFGALRIRGHARAMRQAQETATSAARTVDTQHASSPEKKDDDDDPSQVDTIVLGDAADAPVPARKSDHVSPVHATILIHLPRYGSDSGLIPDTPSGHLLYNWLAAFNQASSLALDKALPNERSNDTAAAQMALRVHTGGFLLLSAKEVQPGVLVFRMRDQTPDANEVLGTLQMRANSDPPSIQTFSLRAVPPRASVHAGAAEAPSPK